MYDSSSDAISRDMNSLLYSASFKHPSDSEFAKIKELISLDPYPDYDDKNTPPVSKDDEDSNSSKNSLMRNRSTPSSFFSNLLLNNNNHQSDENEFDDDERSFFAKNEQHDFLLIQNESLKNEEVNNNSNSYMNNNNSSSSNWDSSVYSSSPSGFNVENGFGGMKEGSLSNKQINFSLGTSRFMPQIIAETDSTHKRSRDSGSQSGESSLVHHMSLPKTSSEMAAVDNFLHFQQDSSVPWKTRAKRGFATHPRSIAERVRRTRISERIKRLQELFPNMDKQTNTADMLDMAVEYIKDLQKELKTLDDARARCTCSSQQLQSGSTM